MTHQIVKQYSNGKRKLFITNHGNYLNNLDKDFAPKTLRQPKPKPDPDVLMRMRITRQACEDIKKDIGSRPAELGGILLSESLDYTITSFVFDLLAAENPIIYQPSTPFLNSVLKGRNNQFVGIAHSHKNLSRLSSQDMRAAWSNITSPGNPHLRAYLMPLIQTIPDTGRFEIIPFIVTCHPEGNGKVVVHQVELQIVG